MTNLEWIKLTERKVDLEDLRKSCLAAMSQIDTLSNQKWHFFRKLLNEYDFESREVAVNRAFYKLWEILKLYPIEVDNVSTPPSSPPWFKENPENHVGNDIFTTLSLAEAPGSFVQVIKKMYPTSFNIAISKPPSTYAEVVKKGKCVPTFSANVLQLENCKFIYADLLNSYYVDYFSYNLMNYANQGFPLITADGGFDEEEKYDAKETLHYNLILSEIVFILLTQKLGGQCVLKIFDTYTDTSVYILWLLCSCYESFDIIKPSTSRPTNAERYVVCRGFKGNKYERNDLLHLMDAKIDSGMRLNISVPDSFVEEIKERSRLLAKQQIDTINNVVSFVQQKTGKSGSTYIDKRQFTEVKRRSFFEWSRRFEYEDV